MSNSRSILPSKSFGTYFLLIGILFLPSCVPPLLGGVGYAIYELFDDDDTTTTPTTASSTSNDPTIEKIEPAGDETSGGATVIIRGTNFLSGETSVTIGGVQASISSVSSERIELTAPANSFGKKDVDVTVSGKTVTETEGFFYADSPTLSAISPSVGKTSGGDSVVLTGSNFVPGVTTATIGGLSVDNISINGSGTQLSGTTPSGVAGPQNVIVETPEIGSALVTGGFTYVEGPTIASISPTLGKTSGGQEVTITGSNFVAGSTSVSFGGTSATNVQVQSATSLTCNTPAASAGAADVEVSTSGGTDTLLSGFTYDGQPPIFSGATSALRTSDSSIELQWSSASDDISASADITYLVYSATSSGGQNFSSADFTSEPGVTRLDVPLLEAGQQYFLVVRARDEAGNIETNTVEVSATTPSAPLAQWFNGPNMSDQREFLVTVLLTDGKVLVAGGQFDSSLTSTQNTAEIYDPDTNSFTATGSMNAPRQAFTGTLLPDGRVLIVGGFNNGTYLNTAELYDPSVGVFSLTDSMSLARSGHTATLLSNGLVLIAGGTDGANAHTSAELYDPTTGIFTSTGSLNGARFSHTATLLPDGRVLVTGGFDGSNYLDSAEIYDPTSGTFKTTASMSTVRRAHTATLLNNGTVLVAAGITSTTDLNTAEIYDPETDSFTLTNGNLNRGRREATACLLPNGKVLITAGRPRSGFPINSAELYDPVSQTFSTTDSLSTSRHGHTAVLLASGDVLAFGGNDGSGVSLRSTEIYSISRGFFNTTDSMTRARRWHTSTLLPDGKVLVAGGFGNPGFPATCELYNPETNNFSDTGNLNFPRSGHTATLLPNGEVVLIGGERFSTTIYDNAEIYTPSTGNFRNVTDRLNQARLYHSATLLPNGNILIHGGEQTFDNPIDAPELYDPDTETFSTLANSGTVRAFHSATLLPSGKVLIAGGYNGSNDALSSAQLFDPNTNTFSSTGSMNSSRVGHTATLLPTGKVLIIGGRNNSGTFLTSAEIYDPSSGTFSQISATLSQPRGRHIANLLLDGKVLLIGGFNTSSNLLDTAEIYDPVTSRFYTLPNMNSVRYLNVACLLADGRVLLAGGEAQPSGSARLTSAELFQPSLGFTQAWQPEITSIMGNASFPQSLPYGFKINISGIRLSGITEGDGGNSSSANNPPLVKLRGLGSGGTGDRGSKSSGLNRFFHLTATNWTQTSLQVTLPAKNHLPDGYYMIYVYANGIPSKAKIIKLE